MSDIYDVIQRRAICATCGQFINGVVDSDGKLEYHPECKPDELADLRRRVEELKEAMLPISGNLTELTALFVDYRIATDRRVEALEMQNQELNTIMDALEKFATETTKVIVRLDKQVEQIASAMANTGER